MLYRLAGLLAHQVFRIQKTALLSSPRRGQVAIFILQFSAPPHPSNSLLNSSCPRAVSYQPMQSSQRQSQKLRLQLSSYLLIQNQTWMPMKSLKPCTVAVVIAGSPFSGRSVQNECQPQHSPQHRWWMHFGFRCIFCLSISYP